MLLDHIGEVFMTRFTPEWFVFRGLGRLAFPIFCYLIVEGYTHTHSLKRYMLRLGAFALISELPYNLAFSKTLIDDSGVNVFFTLLLGLIAVASAGKGARFVLEKLKAPQKMVESVWMQTLCALPVIVGCVWLANQLHTDYHGVGVVVVYTFFLFRSCQPLALVAFGIINSCCMCMQITQQPGIFGEHGLRILRTIQWAAPLACLPLGFYNGEKGNVRWRWSFYVFYPGHLLLLWLAWLIFVH